MSTVIFDTGAARNPSTDIVLESAHQGVGTGCYREHRFELISVLVDNAMNSAGRFDEIPPWRPARRHRVLPPGSGEESRRPVPAPGRALTTAGRP